MLVQFVAFCFCTLLGVAAHDQVDFGSYRIINRASQLCLSSYRTGDPIYVSTQDDLDSHQLWEILREDGDVYAIKNIGLKSYVAADETSDVLVTRSNSNNNGTFFVVFHTEDDSYIINIPNNNLVWTVGLPGIISGSKVLIEPKKGDDRQLWTLLRTDEMTSHNPSTIFGVQTRDLQAQERNLAVIRGIEKLGGSIGYRKYLESSPNIPNSIRAVTISDSFSNKVLVTGRLWSALVYTEISVTMNGCSGSGHAWGAGIAAIDFEGELFYSSLDDLISTGDHFVIVAASFGGVAGTFVVFYMGGTDVGAMLLVGIGGGGLLGIEGSFTWTNCSTASIHS